MTVISTSFFVGPDFIENTLHILVVYTVKVAIALLDKFDFVNIVLIFCPLFLIQA